MRLAAAGNCRGCDEENSAALQACHFGSTTKPARRVNEVQRKLRWGLGPAQKCSLSPIQQLLRSGPFRRFMNRTDAVSPDVVSGRSQVWQAILIAHIFAAAAWWWLMPHGFPFFHARFWANTALPLLVALAGAIGCY